MPKRPITAEDLFALTFVGDPQVHPDGQRVLFTAKTVDLDKNRYLTHLYTVDLDGQVQQWTGGSESCSHGRWSPDGRSIAFLSGREEKRTQIYKLPVGGGEAIRLTNFPEGSLSGFRWSPDGRHLAVLFREELPENTEAAKKAREARHGSLPPKVIDDAWYRLDGDGYFLGQRYKLYLLEADNGTHRELYAGDPMGMYHFDWSPDGTELVVVHSANPRPMFEPDNDQIYRVDLKGQAWKLEGLPGGAKSTVRWSPDGRKIAYLGNSEGRHWHPQNTKLYVVAAEGGQPLCLSDGTDFDLAVSTLSDSKEPGGEGTLEWSPDAKAIYVTVGWHGASHLAFAKADEPGIEHLTSGDCVVTLGNVSADGEKLACTVGNPLTPNEIGIYDLTQHEAAPLPLTRLNAGFVDEVRLSEPEEIWLESPDGTKVHAWVMYPLDYMAPKRYPAILEIHGGPHAQYGWSFFHEFQLLAAQGYVVVYSNPRGSQGYGEAHTCAIAGSWGDRDWEDIQTVTRWMQHQPFIHPGLMGVMGGSYGGYMTNWVISHTHDFRAAITDRCVSNMVSFAGNHDFVMVRNGYFPGAFFGDINQLWKSSPIAYFETVRTPTLVIHSEGDLRCNVEQGEQVFMALQHLGIESRFVRYPVTTSHGMSRNGPPDMRLHRLNEILRWWKKHLNP